MKRFFLSLGVLGLLLAPEASFAHHRPPITIQSQDDTIAIELASQNAAGGASLTVADLGNDGTAELIVAGGLGSEPRVRVLRQDGSEVGSFLAYAPTMGVGVNVVSCDLTGDGYNEIVTAPQRGGGPHIRVFDRFGTAIDNGGFFAYNTAFRGGINLSCGNLTSDTRATLVTLPGPGGGPHVRIWSFENNTATMTDEFFAFNAEAHTGLVATIANNELTVVQQHADHITMKTVDASWNVVEQKNLSVNNVLSVAIMNEHRYVSTQAGDIFSIDEMKSTHVSEDPIVIATLSRDDTQSHTLVSVTSKKMFDHNETTRILVDLSEQRLYAYRDGVLENTFLISSGLHNSTPVGKHEILAKIYEVDYRWNYGPNDPRNYDLGLVPYNLRYEPHLYFHYAYWHNNFGHPMSHGCINVALTDMKWLYNWAHVGVQADIQL